MSSGTELLWPGAALLVLLGVAASLCVRCSRPGAKRSEKIYQQRSLRVDQQSFTGSRTYSLVGQAWPGPLADMAPTRKDKLLQFSPSLEDPASSRYQNFSKGSRHGSEEAYVDPIAMEHYNWGRFSKLPEDDDANSYENVLICKQKTRKTDEESEDYQNSASIHQWRESRKVMGQHQKEASPGPVGSPDEEEDGEPDYVNGEVAATEA
ncbi:linker for activation of T-cells family member 2 isoform X2 [Hylobates moloch]|uniref:linker for activation of T-cells family member 2 isoform X2 n=1 Tax=Hylobates moloch TaxID=81572 RepID=UPI002676B208|nr:linker for activation of T-cells family member 2 isoform X2 [Hylobates moloch]